MIFGKLEAVFELLPMKSALTLLLAIMLIACIPVLRLQSQTVIAFQGGEGSPTDNWTFQAITNAGGPTPPGIVASHARTGAFAIRAGGGNTAGCSGGANCISGGGATGCPMHGSTIQFNPINVSCLSNVQLTVHHRNHTICSGNGWDASDSLKFEVRLNGGAWTTIASMIASGDYGWQYTTNPVGIPATMPNPWVYAVPPGTNSFEFRVRARVNRSDEVFYLDDVSLTTSTTGYNFPGTAGLWNGLSDDNWFNPCNWDDRQVPTAATNVTFPTGSNNDIVIQAGQDCQCNNIVCTGGAGRVIRAAANPAKMLTVFGNLTNSTTAGSTVLQFTDGLLGTPDGTLNLYGNWTNNSSAGDFVEGESTINFLGSANQTVTLGTVEPTEDFFNVTVSKTGGDVVLAKTIRVGGVLSLLNGKVTTAANAVAVANPLPAAVSGHSTASYVNGNLVRAIQMGPGTRVYDFPLGTAANYELASLSLTNPAGFTVIGGFFNPFIGGTAPSIVEAGDLYAEILNAGVWTLAPDLPFVGSYDITLHERGYSNGGATKYIDVRRPDVLGVWTNPGAHVGFSEVGGVVTCTRSGLASFSDFAIALYNFIAAEGDFDLKAALGADATVAIDWTWGSEALQGEFDLLRMSDGQATPLGEWEIGGSQFMATHDVDAPQGLLRYELYHTDLNGNRSRVATDEVWNSGTGEAQPRLWPNPNDGEVHLQLAADENWQLQLIRIDGALVAEWAGAATEIQEAFETAVPELSSGVYIVKCVNAGKSFHLRMVRR
ncbi:MAG TPA: T9SS type A sorting domain-containing protein [Bacteroidia bacterium]|nr:T9SS type A sorting domain-containing protein [Bacteroidia bacterium]